MDTSALPIVILSLLTLFIVTRSVVIVPNGFAYVLERFGRFDRVLQPGVHVRMPFIARVAARIPLTEQSLDVPAVACTTQDGTSVTCGGSVVFRVVDPAVVSRVADVRSAVVQLASRAWADVVSASTEMTSVLAVRGAESQMRASAKALGVDMVKALPVVKLSDEAMRRLESDIARERDARIAAWATERRQPLGPDGRPTPQQFAAFDEWLALQHRSYSRELEAAQREYEAAAAAPAAVTAPTVAAPVPVQFATARFTIAPGALGIVEAGGRQWPARNLSAVEIAGGFRCVVERQDGETLLVRGA